MKLVIDKENGIDPQMFKMELLSRKVLAEEIFTTLLRKYNEFKELHTENPSSQALCIPVNNYPHQIFYFSSSVYIQEFHYFEKAIISLLPQKLKKLNEAELEKFKFKKNNFICRLCFLFKNEPSIQCIPDELWNYLFVTNEMVSSSKHKGECLFGEKDIKTLFSNLENFWNCITK